MCKLSLPHLGPPQGRQHWNTVKQWGETANNRKNTLAALKVSRGKEQLPNPKEKAVAALHSPGGRELGKEPSNLTLLPSGCLLPPPLLGQLNRSQRAESSDALQRAGSWCKLLHTHTHTHMHAQAVFPGCCRQKEAAKTLSAWIPSIFNRLFSRFRNACF